LGTGLVSADLFALSPDRYREHPRRFHGPAASCSPVNGLARLEREMTNVKELSTRLATPDDAAAIAAIYNEGIAEPIATFETEPRTVAQIATQLRDKGDRFPTVVAEQDGRVVAWAGAGPYRSRPAYAGVAEHSVYVARSARGKGAGRAVLTALCREYAERG